MDHDERIAFKCLGCNKINIFPDWKQDGNRCKDCNGQLLFMGYVAIDLAKGKDKTGYPRSNKYQY